MSLDFALTQLYRLAVDDLVTMYDVYYFYGKLKRNGHNISEFLMILQNLMQVESQNFEDIDESKLSHSEEGSLTTLAFDYFTNVILRYLLDDLTQYPFWRAKIAIATTNQKFGFAVVNCYVEELKLMVYGGSLVNVLQGCVPYLVASFIENFPYVVKSTHSFIMAIWSKIPRPPSIPKDLGRPDLNTLSNMASSHNVARVKSSSISPMPSTPLPVTVASSSSRKKKIPAKWYETMLSDVVVTVLSHPFLVISVEMITQPIYAGRSWLYAYYRIVADSGVRALYSGLRSRALFAILPVSAFAMWGVADSIVYRRMLGQGSFDTTGGVLSVAREISHGDNKSSALTLFNYGLLTAVHAVPGFISFLAMRCATGLLFGTSIHRRDQLARRKEIVDAHLNQLKKRSSSAKFNP